MKKKRKEKKKKEEKSPVYVKLNSEEARELKGDVLSYQMGLLQIVKSIKRYILLRENEANTKIKLQNTAKEVCENIKILYSSFPRVEGYHHKQKGIPEKEPMIEYYDHDLDSQLEQIRKKLAEIGR